jgi:hypothetical protein
MKGSAGFLISGSGGGQLVSRSTAEVAASGSLGNSLQTRWRRSQSGSPGAGPIASPVLGVSCGEVDTVVTGPRRGLRRNPAPLQASGAFELRRVVDHPVGRVAVRHASLRDRLDGIARRDPVGMMGAYQATVGLPPFCLTGALDEPETSDPDFAGG